MTNAERAARSLERMAPRLISLAGGPARGTVAVDFLPNRELRALKKKLLGTEARFVDVLAFPHPPGFPHPERKGAFLGEIYLNRALARGSEERLRSLFIHGLLHLLGFRHDGKGDTMDMQRKERELLHAADPKRHVSKKTYHRT